jgi:protein-S-isoprenylcysteine O-methyltransferase Ste14
VNTEEEIPTGAPKRVLPVRDLVVFGTIMVFLGLCSLLYSSRSSTPEVYQLLAAVLVITGLGTFAKIPQQRRAIRQAKRTMESEQA